MSKNRLPEATKAPPCEVCGNPAHHMTRDVNESISLMGDKYFTADGPEHYYCASHNRESKTSIIKDVIDG